jgi:hypothetical protein
MAYRVIKVVRQHGPQFKILFERWVNKARQYSAINRRDWPRHGFLESMTLEQAKSHMQTLNARERIHRQEARRQACLARERSNREEQSAYFPDELLREFEEHKLVPSRKGKIYWGKAKKIMTAVALSPERWGDYSEKFYREFVAQKMSMSYVRDVLPRINKWGAFYCRRLGLSFEPIPKIPRDWTGRIAEANFEAGSTRGNIESDPITQEELKGLEEDELRWLRWTVWFGLRPGEVDLLALPSAPKTWRIEKERLWVFQPKLQGVKLKDRTKAILIFHEEQKKLVAEIGKPIKRPKRKRFLKVFKPTQTLYGGRKGFVALMKGLGRTFEEVSAWLGHQNINRTYQSYFDKTAA